MSRRTRNGSYMPSMNFSLNAELKEMIKKTANELNITDSDLVRLAIKTALPILIAVAESERTMISTLCGNERNRFRRRHCDHADGNGSFVPR